MVNNYISKVSILGLTLVPIIVHATSWQLYVVKRGDNLSKVLYDMNVRPIYGKDGGLEQTVKLNAQLEKSSGNKIYQNQKIFLPIASGEKNEVITESESYHEPVTESERVPSIDLSDDAKAHLSAAAAIDFFKITGKDSTSGESATILSEASPSINLGYHLFWDELTTLSFKLQAQHYKLQALNNQQSFDKDNSNRFSFSFKGTRKLSEKFHFGAEVDFSQDLFLYGISLSKLGVEKVLITKPGLNGRYTAFTKGKAQIGLDARLGLNLASSTNNSKIKNGYHYGLGPYFTYRTRLNDISYKSLETQIFYNIDQQDTAETTRKVSNVSFLIQYEWSLAW